VAALCRKRHQRDDDDDARGLATLFDTFTICVRTCPRTLCGHTRALNELNRNVLNNQRERSS
jgi:hypothetical protein